MNVKNWGLHEVEYIPFILFLPKLHEWNDLFFYAQDAVLWMRSALRHYESKKKKSININLTLVITQAKRIYGTISLTWRLRVPSHVGAKCKSENEQPITEHLEEEWNLKLFCHWLFVFCLSFCAHMGRHPRTHICYKCYKLLNNYITA